MKPTDRKTPTVAWQQVVDAVASGAQHLEETKWTIYRYLKQNYPTLGSKETRMLLLKRGKDGVKRNYVADAF